MAHRRCEGRRQYDSSGSDTEFSEPDENRKSCIKRSKLVFHAIHKSNIVFYVCILIIV